VVLTRTITSSVGELYEATLHVRRGDFTKRVRVRQRDQLGALGESFNEMTSSISELIDEQRQRQRLENEISIAREVQSQLFPQTLPSLPGLQLGAICRPARVVSGDYYDFIKTGPDRLGIALADISGKGIFAALLMASLQAALRSTAMLDGDGGTADLVSKLNRHVFRNTSDDRYATFFYAVYDEHSRTLTYTNAGHLAPFFICDGKVQELEEGGTVVGLFEEFPFTQGVIKVGPGSLLVLFSDGLTEPENVYGEEFGRQRVRAEILRQINLPPQRLAENLIASAEQWAGSPEQADDITVVVARMG
jgi:phosphoserine phosphatase RsbU/P